MTEMKPNAIRGFTINHSRCVYTAKDNSCLDLDSKEIRDRTEKDDWGFLFSEPDPGIRKTLNSFSS